MSQKQRSNFEICVHHSPINYLRAAAAPSSEILVNFCVLGVKGVIKK